MSEPHEKALWIEPLNPVRELKRFSVLHQANGEKSVAFVRRQMAKLALTKPQPRF